MTGKCCILFSMKFTTRIYSKGRIDRAGKELITLADDNPAREETLNVINNWRSCHGYPLQIIKMTLLNRAKHIDNAALIAQRLKRTPSIAIKLKDNPNMKLSQMQDIGGCRAVMASARELNKLYAAYEKSKSKTSGVSSKPASWGHFKTGQRKVPGTLDVVPGHRLFNQV